MIKTPKKLSLVERPQTQQFQTAARILSVEVQKLTNKK